MTTLQQWLSEATKGLSQESAARVREEIQEHYDSAREAGDDALAALGNPRAANRAYRKVLLTEQEALLAPTLTQSNRPSLQRILFSAVFLTALVWLQAGKPLGPGVLPIAIAIFSTVPLRWFLPPTTLERSRINFYVHVVRSVVVVSLAWWYQGWVGALALGALCFVFDYFTNYRRVLVFRKLAAGQNYSLLPEEPKLTRVETIYLNTLRKGGGRAENASVTVLFVMIAGLAIWMPATFAPVAIWTIAGYLARRTLPIYTEARARRLRIARWSTMVVAAMLPFLYGARLPWIGIALLTYFFIGLDKPGISLRRKLPIEQWPKRLYW